MTGAIHIEFTELADGSASGRVVITSSAKMTAEEAAFRDTLKDCYETGATLNIEHDGKRYAGVRITGITYAI